ncbi:uncharacterized protein LOC110816346 [Carica papaya]|uniref:uncharacterized protein LOC110816346 n=1 Tax=Carica papaya TaxID=3649 RepID=UPI000B8C7A04|nr:uncharacterized protein LOC110816346 [Carica papaya]
MEGGEAWSMLRCAGDAQDKTMINRIMLRFRPIAPKPVTGCSVSGHLQIGDKTQLVSKRRTKRKYVRVRENNRYKRNSNNNNRNNKIRRILSLPSSDQERREYHHSPNENNLVTLQLLPERSADSPIREQHVSCLDHGVEDRRVVEKRGLMTFQIDDCNNTAHTMMGSMTMRDDDGDDGYDDDQTVVVESWVTVESVTCVCMDVGDPPPHHHDRRLGSTDADRVRRLDADTCPAFVSDGLNRVRWVNGAYKRMVIRDVGNFKGDGLSRSPEIKVWLVVKEELPVSALNGAFSCRVRVQYTWQKDRCLRMVLPCDVWRMDCGGFAWRLDVENALRLGR